MPPQARMMQMITGYWITQIVHAVADLRLADHLAASPLPVEEIAALTGVDTGTMSRLLRACASQGLVAYDDGRFASTPLLATLSEGTPGSLRDIAIVHGSPGHWLSWGRFPDAVRAGEPQTRAALGSDIWTYFQANPQEWERFSSSMTELTDGLSREIGALLDTTGLTTAVDVGGANGALLHPLLKANPELKGVVFDLPTVEPTAVAEAEKAGLADRCAFVGGSFFDSVPEGDLLLLKAVMHNWDDESCVKILTNCRRALRPGGRVVIVEIPLGPIGEPGFAPLLDLGMLAVNAGRERDLDHYDALLRESGLRRDGVTPTSSPQSLIHAVAE
jgi:SAM-dependent methyltransferase